MKGKVLLFISLTFLFPSVLHARPPLVRLMELYDPNTELILEGRSLMVFNRDTLPLKKPAVLSVSMRGRPLFILMGPTRYVKQLGISIKRGQRVRVIGSKVYGPDGNIYIIPRKMVVFHTGRTRVYTFRDKHYIPLWLKRRKTPGKGWKGKPQD